MTWSREAESIYLYPYTFDELTHHHIKRIANNKLQPATITRHHSTATMKPLHPGRINALITLGVLLISIHVQFVTAFQSRTFLTHTLNRNPPARAVSPITTTKLHQSTAPTLTPKQQDRRSTLLNRNGPFFQLNRMKGTVQFGSTANLVTQLSPTPNHNSIAGWLSDERRVALSLWDPSLLSERGNAVYQLQVMQLQFVTMTLAPTVDVKMWTDNEENLPVFSLQSIAFDPNLQLLPGLGVKADSLGIVIEVVGDLRPTLDGKGVTGKIAFETGGELPPPMRLLPEPALKAASDVICDTVTKFAIQSFQKGATDKYNEYAATLPNN